MSDSEDPDADLDEDKEGDGGGALISEDGALQQRLQTVREKEKELREQHLTDCKKWVRDTSNRLFRLEVRLAGGHRRRRRA